jgi:hypothetical protein
MFFYINANQSRKAVSELSFEQQVRALQIIRGGLILGVLTFLTLVLGFIAGMPKKLDFGLFEIILTFFAVQAFVVYLFAPKFVKIGQDRQDEIKKMSMAEKERALMPYVTTYEIIRGAAIEGATFFGLVMILIADSKVGLFVAAFLIACAIALFPTASRVRSAIESMRYRLGL